MTFAVVNWAAIGIVGSLLTSAAATLIAWLRGKSTDKRADEASASAEAARIVEVGVTELVNQMRTERQHLQEEVERCLGDCQKLRDRITALERELAELQTSLDNKDAEIIGYRNRLGELGGTR